MSKLTAAGLMAVVALVGLMLPPVVDAQEYSAAPATEDWQYGSEVDHLYAMDDCRVLDVADESFHEGSTYWFPVEDDGMERVYSYGCWL